MKKVEQVNVRIFGCYQERSILLLKILEMVETCRNEVMIALPEAGEELVKQALPKLRSLHDKGVDITILTSDKMDKESIKLQSKG